MAVHLGVLIQKVMRLPQATVVLSGSLTTNHYFGGGEARNFVSPF